MRHEAARQRQSDGRFDYTSARGVEIHAIGYCCLQPTLESFERLGIHLSDDEKRRMAEFGHKHHTDGHATAEDACACYREYLLDNHLRTGEQNETREKCQICGEWTGHYATVDMRHFVLCEVHCNRDGVDQVMSPVGEAWCS